MERGLWKHWLANPKHKVPAHLSIDDIADVADLQRELNELPGEGSVGAWLKKNLFCRFFHRKDLCYPRCDLPTGGPWHCAKCHPCSEGLDELLSSLSDQIEVTEQVAS